MWICPRCRQKFVNRNQSHSCGTYSVAGFLNGKPRKSVELFRAFLEAYKKIGPFEIHPVKTRVALLTKMRFASINRIGKDFIDGHFVLVKSLPRKPIIYRIDNLGDRFFIHHFRMSKKSEIDTDLKQHMKLAYKVGLRKHVEDKRG